MMMMYFITYDPFKIEYYIFFFQVPHKPDEKRFCCS